MTDVLFQSGSDVSTNHESGVRISGLRKHFLDPHSHALVSAVDDVDLVIPEGQFCVLLGPSGCGKTTLLRCIAGLEQPSAGRITVDDVVVFDGGRINLEPQRRPIGMVFQNYALWPHLDVNANVAFPLRSVSAKHRKSRAEIAARVARVLEVMGIAHLGKRKIGQLSGGQQQRVALARAVAAGNKVVLFDEPLSNIDAKVREQLRRELRAMQKELGFTAVYVTHDQSEAMEMADIVAVMRDGRVAQWGSPRDIYFHPRTRYVAQFIGATNIFPVTALDAVGSIAQAAFGPVKVGVIADDIAEGAPSVIVSKAQNWLIGDAAEALTTNRWQGTLVGVSFLGVHTEYSVDVNGTLIRIWSDDVLAESTGVPITVGLLPKHAEVVPDDID